MLKVENEEVLHTISTPPQWNLIARNSIEWEYLLEIGRKNEKVK